MFRYRCERDYFSLIEEEEEEKKLCLFYLFRKKIKQFLILIKKNIEVNERTIKESQLRFNMFFFLFIFLETYT